jgi:hypothetical protein
MAGLLRVTALLLLAAAATAQLHPTPEHFKRWMAMGGETVTGAAASPRWLAEAQAVGIRD